MTKISRQAYAQMYGPTVGDRVRLADTDLLIQVEEDHTIYGDEVKTIGGFEVPATFKYLRDFSTAAEYQMYHSLALLAVGVTAPSTCPVTGTFSPVAPAGTGRLAGSDSTDGSELSRVMVMPPGGATSEKFKRALIVPMGTTSGATQLIVNGDTVISAVSGM